MGMCYIGFIVDYFNGNKLEKCLRKNPRSKFLVESYQSFGFKIGHLQQKKV